MLNTRRKKRIKKLKTLVLIALALYVMVGLALYALQEKILFRPSVLAQNYEYQFEHEYEELFLKPEKDASINAIHFKVKQPKGVILYFHGNSDNLQRWGKIAEYFVKLNYDVFVMDYRTYGKSVGQLSEQALYSDAQFCYDYLKEHYDENNIIVFGRSLGSGIATQLTSKNKPKQLILETPYYSIADVAKHKFPLFPIGRMLKYQLPSYQYIQKVTCPIFIFHGTKDYVVPYKSGKKLFEISPKNKTQFFTIDGGGHKNLIDFDAYSEAIQNILK